MLVPADTPCPDCGHPRRNHTLGDLLSGGERCSECDCSIPIAHNRLDWDPDAAPQPFDWSSALELVVLMVEMQTSFTEFVLGARPPYLLAPDELEDLSAIDRAVRDLWARYVPANPAQQRFSTVAEENAAVDAYENDKARLRDHLRNLAATEAWRKDFASTDHPVIDRVQSIVASRQAGSR